MASSLTDAFRERLGVYIREQAKEPALTATQIKLMTEQMDRDVQRVIAGGDGPWMSSFPPASSLNYNGAVFRIDANVPDGVSYEARSGEYVVSANEFQRLRQLARAPSAPPTPSAPPPDPNFPRKLDID